MDKKQTHFPTMTREEIALDMAAECAAQEAVNCFGSDDIPSARAAWDFLNEQVYLGEGNMTLNRPDGLPEVMPNGFGPRYRQHVARILKGQN